MQNLASLALQSSRCSLAPIRVGLAWFECSRRRAVDGSYFAGTYFATWTCMEPVFRIQFYSIVSFAACAQHLQSTKRPQIPMESIFGV